MCPRVPFADMVKHFAPISTVESPDAGKHKQEPIELPAPSAELSAKFPQQSQRIRHVWVLARATGHRDGESSSLPHG